MSKKLLFNSDKETDRVNMIDKNYNYFIFDTNLTDRTDTVNIALEIANLNHEDNKGEKPDLVDWGDGEINTDIGHSYNKKGIYVVKTKHVIHRNLNHPSYNKDTKDQLIGCLNLNKNNIYNFGGLFSGCENLRTLDFSLFDLSNTVFMNSAFEDCINLRSINLRNVNTSNTTNMYRMFWGCNSLISLDLSSFDTCKVTNMEGMLTNCKSLKFLNLSGWGLSELSKYTGMFDHCDSLTLDNIIMDGCSKETKEIIITAFNNRKL